MEGTLVWWSEFDDVDGSPLEGRVASKPAGRAALISAKSFSQVTMWVYGSFS